MKLNKSKKGSINLMVPFAISFVVVVIVIALGGSLMGTFQANQVTGVAGCNSTVTTGCGIPYNVTVQGMNGMKTFGDYLPTIAIVLVIACIIAIIVTYLYGMFAQG